HAKYLLPVAQVCPSNLLSFLHLLLRCCRSCARHLFSLAVQLGETSLQHHGPKVYGVVQRTGSDRQQEVMAREWSVNHLQDEMRYIKEVRDSLEKVRERMYGQFGGMQQSMQKLSQEIRVMLKLLHSPPEIRTAAMERFDQMNSSLISANIDLQKSLLENCQNRVDMRDEVKSLRNTCEKAEEKLKEKERQLAAAQAENQTLKLQVESSQEACSQAVQEVTERLQRQYEEQLMETQRQHREEIEKLQLDVYIMRLEEAERNAKIAEAKIAERDQRISEVERLLDCMGQVKQMISLHMELSGRCSFCRSKQLEEEVGNLRERIKHLNDMVFCQQKKVKGMIEENNELEDKLKYFMSTQNRQRDVLQTREIGVGCDLLPSAPQVYTPFMKLMEITANIDINES
uniref:Myocardial zonula adherens protein n=1 Tax=Myripristis murdjan TaxID=586833 RepID=A0A667Y6J3_9TELE